ncbi:MAG: aminotransferase class I/II-fold pyridoxal phosphate-dependent enzyme [Gemmatimonadota bacterium]
MSLRQRRLQTELIHAGEPHPRVEGAIVLPVFQSATFASDGAGSYDEIRYLRLNNTPNHLALHQKLATICGGEAALVTASGMAAITTSLLSLLRAGDHLLAQDCLYGGTHTFLTEDAPDLGITCTFVPGDDPEAWRRALTPSTRLIYVETMSNPLLQVADLEAVPAFARQHGLVSAIDNTFASPVNYRPLEQGFDLELHSATKYLNGHSDIVAGCMVGSAELIGRIAHRLNHLGGTLDTHACFLLHRGLKTLALRVREQNAIGQRLAELLAGHAAVARVNYPGLTEHPQHARAARLFAGCGGVLSLELTDRAAAHRLLEGLTLPVSAPSLGGVETLITLPAETSHSGLSPAERARLGIGDGLIRVAVGIEAAEDLCADFEQALAGL